MWKITIKWTNKKEYLKKWAVKWTKVKRTQIMKWKKIICKYSLFKECFKTIIIPLDCFCHDIDDNDDSDDNNDSNDSNDTNDSDDSDNNDNNDNNDDNNSDDGNDSDDNDNNDNEWW